MPDKPYLLSRDDIEGFEGTQKVHFLNPGARRVNKSLGDLTGITGFGFHLIEVAPGDETTEHHVHHHEDECVFVLSGTGTAVIGKTEHAIGPGDFIGYRKGGLAHSIRNTGDEALRCIVVGERLDHDVVDYDRQEKRLFKNRGLPWNLVDHGAIDVVGGNAGKK